MLIAWQVAQPGRLRTVRRIGHDAPLSKELCGRASLTPMNAELQTAGRTVCRHQISKRPPAMIVPSRVEPCCAKSKGPMQWPLPAGHGASVFEFLALVGLSIILVLATRGWGSLPGTLSSCWRCLGGYSRAYECAVAIAFPQRQRTRDRGDRHIAEPRRKPKPSGRHNPAAADSSTAGGAERAEPSGQIRRARRSRSNQSDASDPRMLAVVGRSGAGKSTLVHAFLGLVEPDAGSIRLGDYDLASTPLGAWRRTIGYVPQETILFHASIRDNLTSSIPAPRNLK